MSATERKRATTRRRALLGDAEGAFATARYVRIAPMKARRVVDLIRGTDAEGALSVLRFSPQAAAETVSKLLESAVSNATTVEGLQRDSLVVTQAFVDEGPTLKRFRPRAQGRAYRIRKRTSHITVVVQPAAAENGRAR